MTRSPRHLGVLYLSDFPFFFSLDQNLVMIRRPPTR